MKKKLMVLSGVVLSSAPLLALAQQPVNSCNDAAQGTIEGIICKLADLMNILIPILIVLAVLYFIWGVITFMTSSDEEAKGAGKNKMIYGIIGLVIIVGMWGLVGIVKNTFGLNNVGTTIPDLTPNY